MHHKKGNGLVEFVLFLMLYTSILMAVFQFGRYFLLRQRALSASRLGAMLHSTGRVSEEHVRSEIHAYLRRIQRTRNEQAQYAFGRYHGLPAARFYRLVSHRISFDLPGPFSIKEEMIIQKESETESN